MKNLPFLLAAAAAALIGIDLFNKKRAAENLQITPGNVKINAEKSRQAAFFRIFYNLSINIFNPVNTSLDITGIFITVFFDGKEVGTITNTERFTIQPRATIPVNLEASIASASMISLIRSFIFSGNTANISGRFTYSGFIQTTHSAPIRWKNR